MGAARTVGALVDVLSAVIPLPAVFTKAIAAALVAFTGVVDITRALVAAVHSVAVRWAFCRERKCVSLSSGCFMLKQRAKHISGTDLLWCAATLRQDRRQACYFTQLQFTHTGPASPGTQWPCDARHLPGQSLEHLFWCHLSDGGVTTASLTLEMHAWPQGHRGSASAWRRDVWGLAHLLSQQVPATSTGCEFQSQLRVPISTASSSLG